MGKKKTKGKIEINYNVKISILGGVGEIGKNMTVVEQASDMIIVDLGRGFIDGDAFGVEGQIPDISYVLKNKDKLKGILITHGHEDHIGAIEYYWDKLNVPIYGTPLTCGIIKNKLARRGLKAKLVEINECEIYDIGSFKVEFIKVTHSIGGSCSINIKTKQGNIFFTGDYKLDNTPVDMKRTNIARIGELAKEGIRVMLGESTNVERVGHSVSEKVVGESLQNVFAKNKDRRIIIATFASSNFRVQQILNVAKENNRKVLLAGTSMKQIVNVAGEVGELIIPKDLLVTDIKGIPDNELVVLATGSQGQELSALSKMSYSAFPGISVGSNDVIILSSSPIPGNEKAIYGLINRLFERGANVIYEESTDLHVSGHAYREEIKTMIALANPEYLIPLHGEYRHLLKHKNMAAEVGINSENIFIPKLGNQFTLSSEGLEYTGQIDVQDVYVDAKGIVEDSNIIQERKYLAAFGCICVVVRVDMKNVYATAEPEIESRGFNLTKKIRETIVDVIYAALDSLRNNEKKVTHDLVVLEIKKKIKRKIYRGTQLPVLIPIVIEE